jgi:hypothetical protein
VLLKDGIAPDMLLFLPFRSPLVRQWEPFGQMMIPSKEFAHGNFVCRPISGTQGLTPIAPTPESEAFNEWVCAHPNASGLECEAFQAGLAARARKECTNHFEDGSKIFPQRDCCNRPAPEVLEGGTGGEGTEPTPLTDKIIGSYVMSQCSGLANELAEHARALETRLRAVTAERERALYLADAINELCDELDAIQWDDGCPVNYRELQEGAVAFTKGTPFQFIHQKQIETLAAERDAAVAERDGLREKAAKWDEAHKALEGRLGNYPDQNDVAIACAEYVKAEDHLPELFDSEDYCLSDAVGRCVEALGNEQALEDQATTLRASLAAARADGEMLEALRELAGHVEDGSSQSVTFFQDDATKTWFIKAGKREYFDSSFAAAITAAMKGEGK